jgi:hypothetical protein
MLLVGLVVMMPTGLAAGLDHPDGVAKTADIIAGGGYSPGAKDVGDIFVWNDGSYIYVQFVIVDNTPSDPLDDWYITETHVEVATERGNIPQANGNPVPGKFTYARTHENVDECTETVPLGSFSGKVFVAAHAQVCQGGFVGLNLALPEGVVMKTPTPYGVKTSTFPGTIVYGGTFPDGTYDMGWCARLGIGQMPYDASYPATAFSSYADNIPYLVVENQENLDAVNWLLNHKGDYLGHAWTVCPAPLEAPAWWTTAMGAYDPSSFPTEVAVNWFDLQMAIWYLLDDQLAYDDAYCFMHKYWFMQSKVGYDIAQEALQNGDGFVPGPGEGMVVILSPQNGATCYQPILVEVEVPCQKCETAWGAVLTDGTDKKGNPAMVWGNQFPGKNWATYLEYQVAV